MNFQKHTKILNSISKIEQIEFVFIQNFCNTFVYLQKQKFRLIQKPILDDISLKISNVVCLYGHLLSLDERIIESYSSLMIILNQKILIKKQFSYNLYFLDFYILEKKN
ncbi:hypothetical protein pb186bvf_016695 [Paramecium bursaria]